MGHRYPDLAPPNYFGPSEGFTFLMNRYFDSATRATVFASDMNTNRFRRNLFTFGSYGANTQWQNAVIRAGIATPDVAEAYTRSGVGQPCFICAQPCVETGPDSPQIEHILPSTFAFFLFGLSSAQSERSPIGQGGIHQVVSQWIQAQNAADQAGINAILAIMSFYCAQNFKWAHARCNSIKDALVLIDVVSIDNNCLTDPSNCTVLLTSPLNTNQVTLPRFIHGLIPHGKDAHNFVTGSRPLLEVLIGYNYQTNWTRYFSFNVAFAVLTASLILNKPVSPNVTNLLRASTFHTGGGSTSVDGAIPESLKLDLQSFNTLMEYWWTISQESKNKSDIEKILINKYLGSYEPIQYPTIPTSTIPGPSPIIPFQQDNAIMADGGNIRILKRKIKKTHKRKINKKRTNIRKRRTHKKI